MALTPRTIDYTNWDWDSFYERLKSLARSAWPAWTNFNKANFGNLILEFQAHALDHLSFYLDNLARESRVVLALQRKNVLAGCKLIGYTPTGAVAARFTVTFTLSQAVPANDSLTIPAGTLVRTGSPSDPQTFQLLADLVIAAGQSSGTGTVEHSKTWTEVYTSSGLPDQDVELTRTPYVDGSATIVATNGSYTIKPDLLSSVSTDRHCVITVDQNDRARIEFGDGVTGTIPTGAIQTTYKTGGGVKGNVAISAINRIDGSFQTANGVSIYVTVTNAATASVLGEAREAIDRIRVKAPASLRTLTRAVAREDYETAARKVTGVASALMLSNDEDASVGENQGILYVVPTGGGAPSTQLKQSVTDQFTGADPAYPKTLTFQLAVQDPVYLTVNVRVEIALRQGAVAATVKQAIVDALTDHFAVQRDDGTLNPNVDFGYYLQDADGNPSLELAWSDIFNTIRDTSGVRKVDAGSTGLLLNNVRADVALLPKEFPQLGTVTVINSETGLEIA